MLSSPVLLYQIWMFIAPGLYSEERKLIMPFVFLSTLFFVGGALFGYFVVFPYGFQFFLSFATENIQAFPSMKEYLSFSSKLLLAFGIVFELPLFITLMARLGMVTPAFLKQNRKYAILLFFVGAAIITPPDVVTQIMMAFPLMLLYELSILGAKVFQRKPLEPTDEDDVPVKQEGEKE
jgi:sec-independent protein translocase protein TatC